MTRGESRKNAIMLLTKVIGKRPDKKWEPIIDFVHGLEYTAIKAIAALKDEKEANKGKEKNYRETDIRIARFVKKHNNLVRSSNNRIATLTKSEESWKKRAEKLLKWKKKKIKPWKRKIKRRIKNMKVNIKDGRK